jgi:hypothetical protein
LCTYSAQSPSDKAYDKIQSECLDTFLSYVGKDHDSLVAACVSEKYGEWQAAHPNSK